MHHFDEVIDGRTYHIEVARIERDRWRAHIVSATGVRAALMPFYGPTPGEAGTNTVCTSGAMVSFMPAICIS